jgi:hypothetical protein
LTDPAFASCGTGSACRAACQDLVRARLSRRIGYLSERPAPEIGPVTAQVGPAVKFTLAFQSGPGTPPRDLQLVIVTVEGRAPFRVYPPATTLVGNGPVVPWDRSPYAQSKGIRFLSPYMGGSVLDATPTAYGLSPGDVKIIQ